MPVENQLPNDMKPIFTQRKIGVRGKARPRVSGLNKTEARYRDMLRDRKAAGEIQDYFVQAVTFRIGDDCRYVPDFLIIENDGAMTFIEVKGFMRQVGAAKFRVAKEMFWWAEFRMVRWIGKQWVESDKATRNKRRGEVRSLAAAGGEAT